MPRVRKSTGRRRRHKRVLREARGYHGTKSRHYQQAKVALIRAGAFAWRDRRARKRDMRRLWITRITAACRMRGTRYSLFINGLKLSGILLNRNLEVNDTINALVYREASLPEGSQGTATLFIDDVRVSTNVRLFEGRRALGTRVSAAVRQLVLEQGQVWLDRAFVVNDWYISGYVPLADISGNRIGMLYTGFLEAPFTAQRNAKILTLILAFVAVIGLAVPLVLWLFLIPH